MSTVFIAVQCFQCSTMQVKQQKKSGNKWTCVVCNQKQSVRKVYAQGFMARDVRKFVTSFNMSRKFDDERCPDETLIPLSGEQIDDQFLNNQKKRRTDWAEYLDLEDDRGHKVKEVEEGVFEPKIVTELPKELFKKPKWKNYSTGLNTKEGEELFRPAFSKRNTNKHIIPQDKEPRKCQPTMTKGPSKWSDYTTQDDNEPKQCQHTSARGGSGSKWNDYITQDDDELELGKERDFEDHIGRWSHGVVETLLNDQRVEEDIHPDFK